MTRPIDIADIVGGLAGQAESLVRELLPNGVREGAEWRVGSLAGERGRSLAVHLGGARSGVWSDFAAGVSGDALELVGQVLFRGDKRQAIQWATSWLGLDGRDPARLAATRRAAETARAGAEPDDRARSQSAFRLWLEARPSIKDTPAERYLLARGIDLSRLGRQPRALRFHRGLRYPEGGVYPALVATIVRGGRAVGVHRTFLTEDGGKAPVRDAKLSLGPYRGGLVPLWRGMNEKPLADAEPGETLLLGEGIEDTLSAVVARPQFRAAAAVSLSNMGAIALPAAIATVIILGQNDPWAGATGETHAAQRGLNRAIAHFQAQGKTVRLFKPEHGKDANDLLCGAA